MSSLSPDGWSYCVNVDLYNHYLFFEPRNLSAKTYRHQAEFFCRSVELAYSTDEEKKI